MRRSVSFRVEKIDLDGFPATPKSKVSLSCKYGGKYGHMAIVKTKTLSLLDIKWTFELTDDSQQEMIVTLFKSHMFKKDYVIGGLALDIGKFSRNYVCHRVYEMQAVDGIAKPKITCSVHVDEVGASPFCAPKEPDQAPNNQEMVPRPMEDSSEDWGDGGTRSYPLYGQY